MSRRSTRQALQDAIATFQAAGSPIKGLIMRPNGDLVLLTDTPPGALVNEDQTDWVDLAGTSPITGA